MTPRNRSFEDHAKDYRFEVVGQGRECWEIWCPLRTELNHDVGEQMGQTLPCGHGKRCAQRGSHRTGGL